MLGGNGLAKLAKSAFFVTASRMKINLELDNINCGYIMPGYMFLFNLVRECSSLNSVHNAALSTMQKLMV